MAASTITRSAFTDGTTPWNASQINGSIYDKIDQMFGGAGTYATLELGGALKINGALTQLTNDGGALGTSSLGWSDLFLASGAVININGGDVTITHSTNTLTFAGAASGYVFNDGSVGIGVTPGSVKLDIAGSTNAIRTSNVTTDATLKESKYLLRHYTNTEEDVMLAYVFSTATASEIIFGGGSASQNAATTISFYTAANNTTTAGTERMRLTSGGNLAIGATARLYLDGVAGTGDTYIYEQAGNTIDTVVANVVAIRASNTIGVQIFPASGGVPLLDSTGIAMTTWPTTASAANAHVADGNYIRRSTSSLRWKHDVYTLDTADAQAALMAMRPVTYRGNTDEDQRRHVGFIAEEMQQIAPLLCTYDEGGESGTPNYVTYDRVTAYLVAVVQQQQAEIDALKARIH